MPAPRPLPQTRYRIVCFELQDDQQTVILDATAQGFIVVTGTIDENTRSAAKEPTPDRSRSDDGSPA